MKRFFCISSLIFITAGMAAAVEDAGRAAIGKVMVNVYYATNGDPAAAGPKAMEVNKETARRFQMDQKLIFKHYKLLGSDTQPLLRSYESWAEPLKPSDQVLVRFEAQGEPTANAAVLDLELWLARKKILKTDARIGKGRPMFLLGPEWRGGRLIIAVSLTSGTQ